MPEKNRFSRLLKHLLTTAEIKNYTLAQQLSYDVSYISKWTSGQMLPPEKNRRKVLRGISDCIAAGCAGDGLSRLMQEYQVTSRETLRQALYDNLKAEYSYVREIQTHAGTDVAPRLLFFSEIRLEQYTALMRHPVLRRVSALNAVGVFDLFSMERSYQFMIAESEDRHPPQNGWYRDVHYAMLVDVGPDKLTSPYDTLFLVEMLSQNSCIDFQLYGGKQAAGRAMFAVQDGFAISGMLMGGEHCVSVAMTEAPDSCSVLYRCLTSLCSRERLLFHRQTMRRLLEERVYTRGLLSMQQHWMIGRITEHLLPEDLLEELLPQLAQASDLPPAEELRKFHRLACSAVKTSRIQILLYSTALLDLIAERQADLFDRRIRLTAGQVMRCLEHVAQLCRNRGGAEIRLATGKLLPDSEISTKHCVFLSDSAPLLRLNDPYNNLYTFNRPELCASFARTFALLWQGRSSALLTDRGEIASALEAIREHAQAETSQ